MADQTDLLAQLLLGSTGKAAIAAEDPYLGFQKEVSDPLSQLILGATGPGIKTKDKIIGGLLTGLISGIAGGASEDYQTRANKAYQDVIQKSILAGPDSLLQGSPEITRPDVLSPSVFDAAKQNAQMFSVVNRLKQEDLAAQNANALALDSAKTQNDIIANLADLAISSTNANTRQRALQSLANLRAGKTPVVTAAEPLKQLDPQAINGVAVSPNQQLPIAASNTSQTPNVSAADFLDEANGDEVLAGQMARDALKDQRKNETKAASELAPLQAQARSTGLLLSEIDNAIAKVGETGNLDPFGLEDSIREAKLKAAASLNTEEGAKAKERLGQRIILNRQGALAAAEIKKLFAGSTSDWEQKLYLGVSFGTDKTPAENKALADHMRRLYEYGTKRLDVVQNAIRTGKTRAEAEALGDEAFPINAFDSYQPTNTSGGNGASVQGGGNLTAPSTALPNVFGPRVQGLGEKIAYIGGNAAQGVLETPEAIQSMFSPSTYKEAFSTPEKGARFIGRGAGMIAGGTAGAGAGAALGAPLAPFTFGLSSLIGAGLGGVAGTAAGYLGFDKAVEAASELSDRVFGTDIGTDETVIPTLKEVGDAARLGGQGLGIGGVAKGLSKIAGGISKGSKTVVESAKQDVLGIKPGDIERVLKDKKIQYIDENGFKTEIKDAADFQTKLEQSVKAVEKDGFFAEANNNPRQTKLLFDQKADTAGKNISNLHIEANTVLQQIYDSLPSIQKNQFPLTRKPSSTVPNNLLDGKHGYPTPTKGGFNPDFSSTKAIIDNATVSLQPALKRKLALELIAWEKSNKSFKALQEFKAKIGERTKWKGSAEGAKVWETINKELYNAFNKEQLRAYDFAMSVADPNKVGALRDANLLYHSYENLLPMIASRTARGAPSILGSLTEVGAGAAAGAGGGYILGGSTGAVLGGIGGAASKPLAQRFPITALNKAEQIGGFSDFISNAMNNASSRAPILGPLSSATQAQREISTEKKTEKLMPTEKTVDLVKKLEGKSLKAYKDTGGVKTIGYGHTGDGVDKGIITEKEAEELLQKDLTKAESAVLNAVQVDLTPSQLSALTSLVYNVGEGAFKNSTLLKKLNAGDIAGAAAEFDRWVYDNGKRVMGLVNRRGIEKRLFLRA